MNKKPNILIYQTPEELAAKFSLSFAQMTNDLLLKRDNFYLALSGGRTPRHIFTHMADEFAEKINWKKIHLFWGDERCVPMDDIDSNYGMTKTHLLDKINIPKENVHFINGSEDPVYEASRYEEEISSIVPLKDGFPRFDMIMLGMGDDGHTASIFPTRMDLLTTDRVCDVSEHPLSKKKRITLTGKVINNSAHIVFFIIGKHKAENVSIILKKKHMGDKLPSKHISPVDGIYEWYLDESAASLLNV